MPASEEDMVAQLTRLGYRVDPPQQKPKPPQCHVCGAIRDYGSEYYDLSDISDDTPRTDWLMQVIVIINPSNEGHDKVVHFFCEDHDVDAVETLVAAGYTSHHHGGTAMLADRECPGERNHLRCPHGRHNPYFLSDDGMYIDG